MNKKRKDNLIKAFEELGAPDKDVLLQKIESKKALGGNLETQKAEKKQKVVRRAAWTSIACSVLLIALVVILITSPIFVQKPDSPNEGNNGAPNAGNDGSSIGADIIDYRSSWRFTQDDNISFDDTDTNIKDAGIELIYDYLDDWTIVETQVTQDESAYREYYVKKGVRIEVTVFLAEKYTSMDGRYNAILQSGSSFASDKYRVYVSTYSINGRFKFAYTIYLKDQVYIFTSDISLRYLFE